MERVKTLWATRWGGFIVTYLASLVTFAVFAILLHLIVALLFQPVHRPSPSLPPPQSEHSSELR